MGAVRVVGALLIMMGTLFEILFIWAAADLYDKGSTQWPIAAVCAGVMFLFTIAVWWTGREA